MKSEREHISVQQQELISMIFGLNSDQADDKSLAFQKGLTIYQNNLLMTAARALSLSYPVLEKMLGQEAIISLSRALLQKTPPDTGDWGDWGEGLGDLIGTTPLSTNNPYLEDMAKLEWLVHQVSRSAEPIVESETLSKLSDDTLESVYLRLSDSVRLLNSPFPLAELWFAHQSNGEPFVLDEQALAKSLSQFSGESFLMVYQKNQVAHVRAISESDYRWLTDILLGFSVSELLDRHPNFNFIQWLSEAVQDRILVRLD